MRLGAAGSGTGMNPEDEFEDQDAEPTSGAPGDARPQNRPTPSEPGEPRTNIEARVADGQGAAADEAADQDARLPD